MISAKFRVLYHENVFFDISSIHNCTSIMSQCIFEFKIKFKIKIKIQPENQKYNKIWVA